MVNIKNSLFPHQVIHLVLVICEAGISGDIFPQWFAGFTALRCAYGDL